MSRKRNRSKEYFDLFDQIKEVHNRKMRALKIIYPEWKKYKRSQ